MTAENVPAPLLHLYYSCNRIATRARVVKTKLWDIAFDSAKYNSNIDNLGLEFLGSPTVAFALQFRKGCDWYAGFHLGRSFEGLEHSMLVINTRNWLDITQPGRYRQIADLCFDHCQIVTVVVIFLAITVIRIS